VILKEKYIVINRNLVWFFVNSIISKFRTQNVDSKIGVTCVMHKREHDLVSWLKILNCSNVEFLFSVCIWLKIYKNEKQKNKRKITINMIYSLLFLFCPITENFGGEKVTIHFKPCKLNNMFILFSSPSLYDLGLGKLFFPFSFLKTPFLINMITCNIWFFLIDIYISVIYIFFLVRISLKKYRIPNF